jgi:prefoldin alpha subunit
MERQQVDISQLSVQQLQELYQQLSNEVDGFVNNMVALQQTATRFAAAGQSVEYLKDQKQGQPVLLPMTGALYVAGTLDSVDSVLLEIGTGYYVEVCLANSVFFFFFVSLSSYKSSSCVFFLCSRGMLMGVWNIAVEK